MIQIVHTSILIKDKGWGVKRAEARGKERGGRGREKEEEVERRREGRE